MKPLLWMDLEMTGLDDQADQILEVAAVITDWNLKPLGQLHRIVYQPQEVLDGMNDWCKKTHGESGLTQAALHGTPLDQVERETLTFLASHFAPTENQIVLCGNSISNDRRFIDRKMPTLAKRLHYRMIDVSSFKEIFREKYGVSFQKSNHHRAVDDIFESIRELDHYLSFVNVPTSPGKAQK